MVWTCSWPTPTTSPIAYARPIGARRRWCIHPWTSSVSRSRRGRRDNYLVASRFVPYKRVGLVVEAFRAMPNRTLTVVGAGTEEEKIRHLAAGAPNITLLPPQPQGELVRLLQQARAFVFPAEEDFGIGLVEAQACGTPVIAFGRGGVRDIIGPRGDGGPTGVLFDEQNVAFDHSRRCRASRPSKEAMTPALCQRERPALLTRAIPGRDGKRGGRRDGDGAVERSNPSKPDSLASDSCRGNPVSPPTTRSIAVPTVGLISAMRPYRDIAQSSWPLFRTHWIGKVQ